MSECEQGYLRLVNKIMEKGEVRDDRTGTGTFSLFGEHLDIRLDDGFPLLTTKFVSLKNVAAELVWFLGGSHNVADLCKLGCNIWVPDAYRRYKKYHQGAVVSQDEFRRKMVEDEDGYRIHGVTEGIYGTQWREWPSDRGSDQIASVIWSIKNNSWSRRHVVSAWNVACIEEMLLPPCHLLFQFYVHTDASLSCHMYQRSADAFLGVPYNIASYALLTHIIAEACSLRPNKLRISFGDVHLYQNHLEQAKKQVGRPASSKPTLEIQQGDWNRHTLEGLTPNLFSVENYNHQGILKAPISVGE